jgi:hypothetical protein
MSAPRIITVTWDDDPNAAAYEAFAEKLGASAYWQKAVSEYGVGPAQAAASDHVRTTDPLTATMEDTAIENRIAKHVFVTQDWPANDENALYVLWVPPTVKVKTEGKNACSEYGGYHSEVASATGEKARFAIIPTSCASTFQLPVLDFATGVASHEIGEAATDPLPDSAPGLNGFDDAHQAWEIWQSKEDENGDACEFFSDDYLHDPETGAVVQRLWSNAAAAAGHDPCVPADPVPYFNVTALDQEAVNIAFSTKRGDVRPSRGYAIPVGQSRAIKVGFWSDAPSAPWTIKVVEGDGLSTVTTRHLKVAVDRASGSNGDVATVTVTPTVHIQKGVIVTIISELNGKTRYRPILIAPQ